MWVENIKHLLCSLDFSGIWYSQRFPNSKWLMKAVNQKIKDQFIQNWTANIELKLNSNVYKFLKQSLKEANIYYKCPCRFVKDIYDSEHVIISFLWKQEGGKVYNYSRENVRSVIEI